MLLRLRSKFHIHAGKRGPLRCREQLCDGRADGGVACADVDIRRDAAVVAPIDLAHVVDAARGYREGKIEVCSENRLRGLIVEAVVVEELRERIATGGKIRKVKPPVWRKGFGVRDLPGREVANRDVDAGDVRSVYRRLAVVGPVSHRENDPTDEERVAAGWPWRKGRTSSQQNGRCKKGEKPP